MIIPILSNSSVKFDLGGDNPLHIVKKGRIVFYLCSFAIDVLTSHQVMPSVLCKMLTDRSSMTSRISLMSAKNSFL